MKRRYLLDTGIAQDFQDDRHGVRAQADAQRKLGHRIGICVPVLGVALVRRRAKRQPGFE